MKRWLVGWLVVGLVGVLVGAGVTVALVGQDDDDPTQSPSSSAAPPTGEGSPSPDASVTEPPDPALASYYSQTLDWSSCGDDECARLTVPLSYDDPAGETIELALLRVPASVPSARVGSLVVNPGGPGAPGTSYAQGASSTFGRPLLEHFDIVGFDPRGTGDSDPVDCLSDDQLDAYLAEDPDPDTPAEVAEFMATVREFGRGCSRLSGDLARNISTEDAARDMDILRAALGEPALDYLGASYGTKLGATYANLFPDKVGRLVLDGALDLTLSSRDLAIQQAAGFQTALDAYLQDCIDSTDSCFLGSTVAEGQARIEDLLASIDATPLPAGGGRLLTSGNAFYGIITPLYVRDYWYLLTEGLKSALNGDGTTLMLLADAYASRNPAGGGYLDNTMEANVAINCLDDGWSIPASKVADQIPDFVEASPVFGRVFAWALVGCRGFGYPAAEPAPAVLAQGAAPILVIGTTRDPATPLQWAQALADQLASGVLVTRDGDGHTGYNSGNQCVDDAVEGYLVDGTVPRDGLAC
ncbi:MAG: alpha/beta fold hydrolase [Nocardioidaceae bacterium]|nr:alpha/beta fold hydrolase [Nocardioidaceae bacterium]